MIISENYKIESDVLSDPTVLNIRTRLEAAGTIKPVEKRLGRDNKEQSSEKQVVNMTTEPELRQ